MFINYAHRGASAYAPENTISSFRKALELQATGIELDLQSTADGKIVISHDKTIDRHSDGTGRISDYTYEELLRFDFGSWFAPEFKDERIVLFEDFAREFLPKKLTFAIELKQVGIEKEVLAIIRKYAVHDDIYISSFEYEALENTRKLDADIKLSGLIRDSVNEKNTDQLLRIRGTQICPKAENVTQEGIDLAAAKGLRVRLWGVSNEEIMRQVYALDTDGMTVNFPDKLRRLMEEDRRHKEATR